jgi:hypothetical protein
LRADNEDIIQYLHRKLQSRNDQCAELKERLKGLQMASVIFIHTFSGQRYFFLKSGT